jgi:hypothetical protein
MEDCISYPDDQVYLCWIGIPSRGNSGIAGSNGIHNGYYSLDGDIGFSRCLGGDKWNPEALTENLGREWRMLNAAEYKPYPYCRDLHVGLNCFIKIIKENQLSPEDMESDRVQPQSSLTGPLYMTEKITGDVAAQFSFRCVIAAAANGVSLAESQDPDKIEI